MTKQWIYNYSTIQRQVHKDLIKLNLSKQKNWPANKVEHITKHRNVFSEFIESIDFDLLQKSDKYESVL